MGTLAFLLLDLASDIPLYQQIRDQIVVAIADGRLPDGSALPTTRQLALDFGINFHTVNKAYDVLRGEGFVTLTRRHGCFVRRLSARDPQRQADWDKRLRVLLAEQIARGVSADEILAGCRASLRSFEASDPESDGHGRRQKTVKSK